MADAMRGFTITKPLHLHSHVPKRRLDMNPSTTLLAMRKSKRASQCKANAFPDWTLMAVLVEQVEGQREFISNKSIWHLSDKALKNVVESGGKNIEIAVMTRTMACDSSKKLKLMPFLLKSKAEKEAGEAARKAPPKET